MLLLNISYIPGKEFEILGVVKGNVVQSKNVGRDIMAGLKSLVGGELVGYTEVMNEAREIATNRMTQEALALGADAVLNLRYVSATITPEAAEVLAYGTAVKFK